MLCVAPAQASSRRGGQAEPAVARLRAGLPADGERLSRHARCLAQGALADAARHARHRGRHRVGVRRRSRRAFCPPRTPASSSCARRPRPTSPSRPCSTASASSPSASVQDPDVLYINSNVAQSFFNPTLNRGSIFVQLKVRSARKGKGTISEVQTRMRRSLAGIPGIRAFPVPLQNLRIGSRSGAALYQYTLTSVNQTELYDNAQRLIDRVKQAPGFTDVTSDLTLGRAAIDAQHRSRRAGPRYGLTMDVVRSTLYSAFGNRKIATVYTPSNDYAVILETDKRARARSRRAVQGLRALQHRPAGAPRCGHDREAGPGPRLGRAPEPAAGRHHHLQSGAGLHAGRGGGRHARPRARGADARDHHRPVRRHGAGVREFLPRPAAADRWPPSSPSTSCSASSTRASSTRSRSCRACPRPASARSSSCGCSTSSSPSSP